MRRVLIGLGVIGLGATAFTFVATAGASATAGQVAKLRILHGPVAIAGWMSGAGTSSTTTTSVMVTPSELSVDHFVGKVDANGNVTGPGTDTFAAVTSGFSVAIDKAHLTTASTRGSGIPATTCHVDANFNETNCHATTIKVTVAWTGQGPVLREVSNAHFKQGAFSENEHLNGAIRDATATGTFSGRALDPTAFQFGQLAFINNGIVVRCIGLSC